MTEQDFRLLLTLSMVGSTSFAMSLAFAFRHPWMDRRTRIMCYALGFAGMGLWLAGVFAVELRGLDLVARWF